MHACKVQHLETDPINIYRHACTWLACMHMTCIHMIAPCSLEYLFLTLPFHFRWTLSAPGPYWSNNLNKPLKLGPPWKYCTTLLRTECWPLWPACEGKMSSSPVQLLLYVLLYCYLKMKVVCACEPWQWISVLVKLHVLMNQDTMHTGNLSPAYRGKHTLMSSLRN